MTEATGLEPAASRVTGRRPNQPNYASADYVARLLLIPSRSFSISSDIAKAFVSVSG
jgi:hypothetical protein